MIKDLLELSIEKRPTTLRFDGRILYLLDDAELVKAQLYEGEDVELILALFEPRPGTIAAKEMTNAIGRCSMA